MVECGGLENRFTRNPRNEGSNPSSSATKKSVPQQWGIFIARAFPGIRTDEVDFRKAKPPVAGLPEIGAEGYARCP